MEQMRYNNGVVLVRVIPGDGNCLFAALVNQYYKYDIRDARHGDEIAKLRRIVVQHIRSNADRYMPCLLQTINEMGIIRNNKNEDQAIQDFLHRLEN